jgi:DNA polymerase (family 10)
MKLEEAVALADKVVSVLGPLCERVEVVGSIRRQKPDVNDIDIVAIPAVCSSQSPLGTTIAYGQNETWKQLIPQALMRNLLSSNQQLGQELMRFRFRDNGLQVDMYRARVETWGVLLLVRTGSQEHNVKLCSLARSKGLMLSAARGMMRDGKVVASRTEEEIFAALGLPFVEPKDREV